MTGKLSRVVAVAVVAMAVGGLMVVAGGLRRVGGGGGAAAGVVKAEAVNAAEHPYPKIELVGGGDAEALKVAEAIERPWSAYGEPGYFACVYAVADLVDGVRAGARLSPAARVAIGEAVNSLERAHGADPLVVPWIVRAREAVERSGAK